MYTIILPKMNKYYKHLSETFYESVILQFFGFVLNHLIKFNFGLKPDE